MCKACKMDPREVARLYERQGAVDVDDFDKEVNYQTRMKGRGYSRGGSHKQKAKTRPGCPGNDYKAHVYVWTTESEEDDFFSDYYGFHKRQHRICAGCNKFNGSKLSDEYMKVKERKWQKIATPEKGVPVPRWRWRNGRITFRYWNWESYDKDYMAAKRAYIQRNGWPAYLYNSL